MFYIRLVKNQLDISYLSYSMEQKSAIALILFLNITIFAFGNKHAIIGNHW